MNIQIFVYIIIIILIEKRTALNQCLKTYLNLKINIVIFLYEFLQYLHKYFNKLNTYGLFN
jgi:hypothetical protein